MFLQFAKKETWIYLHLQFLTLDGGYFWKMIIIAITKFWHLSGADDLVWGWLGTEGE